MVMYKYGMRLRPCGIGCQPKGFIDCLDGDRKYWNYLLYDRELSPKEVSDYELDFVEKSPAD